MSKHFLMFFMFLSIVLGRGTQVMSQISGGLYPTVDYSNLVMTTDCCPAGKRKLDSIMNNAPIVFEGRVVKGAGDSYLFEIEKVYKGGERLQAGTVEVISKRSEDGLIRPVSFHHGWHIIFAKEVSDTGEVDANNSIKLELYNHDEFHSSYFAEMIDIKPYYSSLMSLYFRTKEELRDFLATSYGLRPTDFPKADTLKTIYKYEIKKAKEDEEREKWYRENAAPYVSPEKFDSVVRDMKLRHGLLDTTKNKGINKIHKRGNEKFYITLDSIKNTVSSGNRFLDFDIMGRTDNMGNYLPSMEIILYYNADSIHIDNQTITLSLRDTL